MAERSSIPSLCIGLLCVAAGIATALLLHGGEAIVISLILALLGIRICAREIGGWLSDDGDQPRP